MYNNNILKTKGGKRNGAGRKLAPPYLIIAAC